MSPSKFNLDDFFNETDVVAVVAPARDMFSLLARSLTLPSYLAALVSRKAGDRVLVTGGGEVGGDDVTEVMFLRTSPLDLAFERANLTTKDDYLCRANVALRLSIVPERGEAESFGKTVLGSRRVVQLPAIAQYLEPMLTQALTALAGRFQVEELVDGKCLDDVAKELGDTLSTPCFEAGLALAGGITTTWESDALRQVRAKEAQTARRLDEHAAQQQLDAALTKARGQRLEDLEATLQRLQRLAADAPNVALPELLRTFSESERAKLYQTVFEAQPIAPATKWLVVASGQELLYFSPDSLAAPARRVRLEGEIGSLRSVQTVTLPDGRRRLLAGAARGVYELGVDDSTAETSYTATTDTVRGGVNSATLCGGSVFATHSELGLLRWAWSQPDSAAACCADLTAGAKAVRNVRTSGERVFFSVNDRIISFDPANQFDRRVYSGSSAVITALLVEGNDVFAGNADGQVLHWPDGETNSPRVLHGGSRRPAESVALLASSGVTRLFYTDTTLSVYARVLGDTFVCRFEAGGQTLQRAVVASDLIVATDDPRHRLFIWHPNCTAQPTDAIHIARLTDHRIQDTTLVPLKA